MTITAKRILILFSVCLNIGFLAMASYHIVNDGPPNFSPHRRFMHLLNRVDMSEGQREAMLALENQLHKGMKQWKKELLAIKTDSIQALTLPDGPDTTRLAANREAEMPLIRTRNDRMQTMFLKALDILGPEKLKELGTRLIDSHRDR